MARFTVITDYSSHIKCPLADFEITPDVAIMKKVLTCTYYGTDVNF